jgi:hypothetical protein
MMVQCLTCPCRALLLASLIYPGVAEGEIAVFRRKRLDCSKQSVWDSFVVAARSRESFKQNELPKSCTYRAFDLLLHLTLG